MEAQRILSILLATEPFEPAVESFTSIVGMAAYPPVTVLHSASTLNDGPSESWPPPASTKPSSATCLV